MRRVIDPDPCYQARAKKESASDHGAYSDFVALYRINSRSCKALTPLSVRLAHISEGGGLDEVVDPVRESRSIRGNPREFHAQGIVASRAGCREIVAKSTTGGSTTSVRLEMGLQRVSMQDSQLSYSYDPMPILLYPNCDRHRCPVALNKNQIEASVIAQGCLRQVSFLRRYQLCSQAVGRLPNSWSNVIGTESPR